MTRVGSERGRDAVIQIGMTIAIRVRRGDALHGNDGRARNGTDREAVLGRAVANRIEQRIVRAAARQQLDAHRASRDAAIDLADCVLGEVRVDRHEHAYEVALLFAQGEHRVVSRDDIGRRRKVGGRGEPVRAEHRCDVTGDSDARSGAQPRGIHVRPVGSTAAGVEKMRVCVDERLGRGRGHDLSAAQ